MFSEEVGGKAAVGTKLTVKPGAWSEGTTFSYQWKRGNAPISGATKDTYTPVVADLGKRLSVVVTGIAEGFAPATAESAPTGAVGKGVLTAAKPKISGTLQVGSTVTAKAGSWTGGTTLHYRWFADGKAVKGGTHQALKLTKKLAGKRLTVTVTGAKAGYAAASKTSAATAPIHK